MRPLRGSHEHASTSCIPVTLTTLSRVQVLVTGVKRVLIETPACDGHSLIPVLKLPLLVRFYHSFLPPLNHKVISTGMNDIYSPCLVPNLFDKRSWADLGVVWGDLPSPLPISVSVKFCIWYVATDNSVKRRDRVLTVKAALERNLSSQVNAMSSKIAERNCYGNIDCKTVRTFAYSSTREQSNKRSGTRLKTESEIVRDWERDTHALRACEACALGARKTLTPRFTDFWEKKNPAVLQSTG